MNKKFDRSLGLGLVILSNVPVHARCMYIPFLFIHTAHFVSKTMGKYLKWHTGSSESFSDRTSEQIIASKRVKTLGHCFHVY